jgi:hypothetical protein
VSQKRGSKDPERDYETRRSQEKKVVGSKPEEEGNKVAGD